MNTKFNYKQISFIFAAFIIICIGNIIIVAQDKSSPKNKVVVKPGEIDIVQIGQSDNVVKTGNKNRHATYRTDGGDFCSTGDGKESVTEYRETILASSNSLTVDSKKNGEITVFGENRSDILVRACVQALAKTSEAATQLINGIRIEKGSNIYAEASSDEKRWSVKYQIYVPHKIDLKLKANNGGISINSVDGDIEFETQNGNIMLVKLAGNVKGRIQNGNVSVKLSGTSWNGNGLDVETQNGGVSIKMDENYAANIETGTVNGGFSSEIDALKIEKKDGERYGWQTHRINKSINGGGEKIRIITTNGRIRIKRNL
jgi:hypothetical protein